MELDQIAGVIREVTEDPNLSIGLDDSFERLGLSSFDLMVIISIVESEYCAHVEINEIANEPTIRGLLSSIHSD